jgi:hypothetical protein
VAEECESRLDLGLVYNKRAVLHLPRSLKTQLHSCKHVHGESRLTPRFYGLIGAFGVR